MTCRHGAPDNRHRRGNPAADAAAALWLPRRVAAEAQSIAGTGTADGAGAAGNPAPHSGAAAPAAPAAPGIRSLARTAHPTFGEGRPDDPAAWGHAARSLTVGENLEDPPPPSYRLRKRQAPRFTARPPVGHAALVITPCRFSSSMSEMANRPASVSTAPSFPIVTRLGRK